LASSEPHEGKKPKSFGRLHEGVAGSEAYENGAEKSRRKVGGMKGKKYQEIRDFSKDGNRHS